MKKVTATFTRKFTRGVLVGICHNDKLTFVSRQSAYEWLEGVSANIAAGVLDYMLVEFSVSR